MKKVLRGQKWNTKFILGLRVNFKSYVSEMEEFISNLVNILASWYALNLIEFQILFQKYKKIKARRNEYWIHDY